MPKVDSLSITDQESKKKFIRYVVKTCAYPVGFEPTTSKLTVLRSKPTELRVQVSTYLSQTSRVIKFL